MSQEDREPAPNALDGRSLDDAVDAVVNRDGSHSASEVRQVLSSVAEDGVVSVEAADEAVAHLSNVVSTPETRAELAGIAFEEVTEAAEPVDHLDVVQARLDRYETRLDELEANIPELGEALDEVAAYEGDLYKLAARIQRLTTAANRTQQTADELQVELEEFERWLSNQTVRYDEFADELDALGQSIEDLSASADQAAELLEASTETHITLKQDPVATWTAISLRHRALGLLFDDLQAELAALREWPDRETPDHVTELDARLDGLRTQWQATGERLETAGPDEDRYVDVLREFEDALDTHDPPIDWGAVQTTLDEYRGQVESLT